LNRNRAFTLVEVLVALGIFTIGVVGVVVVSTGLLRQAGLAEELDQGCLLARTKIANMMNEGTYEEGTEEGDFEDDGLSGYQWRVETSAYEEVDGLYEIEVTVWKDNSKQEWKLVTLVREGDEDTTSLYID